MSDIRTYKKTQIFFLKKPLTGIKTKKFEKILTEYDTQAAVQGPKLIQIGWSNSQIFDQET